MRAAEYVRLIILISWLFRFASPKAPKLATVASIAPSRKSRMIAYVHFIDYPAGESKDGPISLVEEGFPVILVCLRDETHKTILGNIMEIKARGASITAVIEERDEETKEMADDYIEVAGNIRKFFHPYPLSFQSRSTTKSREICYRKMNQLL